MKSSHVQRDVLGPRMKSGEVLRDRRFCEYGLQRHVPETPAERRYTASAVCCSARHDKKDSERLESFSSSWPVKHKDMLYVS